MTDQASQASAMVKEAAELFSSRASIWAEKYATTLRARLVLFQSAVTQCLPKGGRLIDFGCGAGVMVAELAQAGYQMIGIDASKEMIEHARQQVAARQLNCDFLSGDVAALTTLPSDHDGLIASSVLEYLPHPKDALAIMSERIRPGGYLFVSVPNQLALVRRLERALRFPARLAWHFPLPIAWARYAKYLQISRNHFTKNGMEKWCQELNLELLRYQFVFREVPSHGRLARWRSSLLFFVLKRL
jgi:2-polyprenyl-3-methyl-5-hydroxy-6-metoxy-1,4-benzoquinol methylase